MSGPPRDRRASLEGLAACSGRDEGARRAEAAAVDLDVEDLVNSPGAQGNVTSPAKRTKWDVEEPLIVAPPQALTLEQLTAQLTAALGPITGGLQDMQRRVASMEGEVTAKIGSALELIRTLDTRQKNMNEQVESIREQVTKQAEVSRRQEQDIAKIHMDIAESKTRERATESSISEILRRIHALEEGHAEGRTWQHHPFLGEQGGYRTGGG